jgi:hypothetical protein
LHSEPRDPDEARRWEATEDDFRSKQSRCVLTEEKNVLLRLLESRKFVIATLTIVAVTVLVAMGKATFAQLQDLVKWLATVVIGSIAVEDAASKLPEKGDK